MYVTCYSTLQLLKGTQKAYKYGVIFMLYTRTVKVKTCVITLCMYAQQGYAFGRVGLYSVCQQKNRLLSASP